MGLEWQCEFVIMQSHVHNAKNLKQGNAYVKHLPLSLRH